MGQAAVRVSVLGPVRIEHSDSGEAFGPRLRRLLGGLVVNRGSAVAETKLVELVWPEEASLPANPVASLRTYVSRLRGHLGADAIESAAPGYRLVVGRIRLDALEFEAQLDAAAEAHQRADDRAAVSALEAALALWDGPAFVEFADEAWAMAEARRLNELRVDAEEQRAELLIGLGDIDGHLLADLERLAIDHPHREGPTRLLMVALHLAGRQADALAAFGRHRDQLATDLGLEPSAGLRGLEEQILVDDPAATATLTKSRPLRGYEIVERLGEGAFSIVYRGTQPSVGREVAIKQIRAELANRPEFIRRFETEAHLVARLEHPHIVPLIDYWREPGSAYLVMRLLRGGSLESAVRDGPWDLGRTLRMAEQVGAALSVAHRAGVVHRDVKPANILLDDEGNAYLTDFGIALDAAEAADPDASLSAGSPAYASPEQLRREPVGPTADVHGLAIAVYEALTGHLPFPDETTQAALLQRQMHDPIPPVRDVRTDLPTAVDGVLARATAKNPADRFPTIEEFVDALRAAAGRGPVEPTRIGVGTVISAEARNPYKGLRAFDEGDAGDFAGRARLVDQLTAAVAANRLVAVVGPSGSGKSSVVRAGLLPALRAGVVPGSDQWFITTLVPGPNPFEELETALLRVASKRPSDLLSVLADGPRGIARGVRHAVPDDDAQILLVVDQFEELFTLADPAETARFLDALAVAVTEERPRLRVVLTLRADFYDRPLRHDGIGRLVKEATVAVLPLAPDELEHAIVDPAHAVGAEFEPGLVSEIVADVADQPGALPLLQYALTELYERQISGLLTRDAYRSLGGVAGALARRAESLYAAADREQQTAVRRAFGRLVSLGEGTEDTRRRSLRSELGRDPATEAILGTYGAARLLSFDRDPMSREPTVEVAHEALLREWPRLRIWLDEDRDDIRIQRHLHTAAGEWDTTGRPDAELYRGGRLETAEDWAAAHVDELTELERDFLTASQARRQEEHEAERRTQKRLRRLLAVVGAVAALALAAGAVAAQQQHRAGAQADLAESRRAEAESAATSAEELRWQAETGRIASQARLIAAQQRDLGLLLAAEVYRRGDTPEALGALQQALVDVGPFLGIIGGNRAYHGSTWLNSDTVLAAGPGGISIIDVETRSVRELTDEAVFARDNRNSSYDDQPLPVYVTDDDNVAFVTASDPASIRILDLGSGSVVGSVTLDSAPLEWLAMSPGRLAALDISGQLFLMDLDSGSMIWSVEAVSEVVFADFELPDGYSVFPTLPLQEVHTWAIPIAFSEDGSTIEVHTTTLRRFSVETGEVAETALGTRSGSGDGPLVAPLPYQAIPSPTRSEILTRSATFVQVLDRSTDTYQSVARVEATTNTVRGAVMEWVCWNGGETANALLSDGRIVVLNVADGTPAGPSIDTRLLDAHHLSVSPDGRTGAVASRNGIALFALDGRRAIARSFPREGTYGSGISIDGRFLVQAFPNLTGNDPRVDRLQDAVTGAPIEPPMSAPRLRLPTGTNVLVADTGQIPNKLEIFDADSMEPIGSVEFASTGTLDIAIMPQAGALVATTWFDGVSVFDLASGEKVTTLDEVGDQARSPSFSPNGKRLAIVDRNGRPSVWNTDDWTLETAGFDNLDEPLVALRYRPGGQELVTLDRDGQIAIRDAQTYELIRTFATTSKLDSPDGLFAFDETGRFLLAVAGPSVTLWDVEAGEQIGRPFPNDEANVVAIQDGPDAPRLVTAEGNSRLIWDLQVDNWFDLACRLAGRNMTLDEWEQYGPSEPYEATCPLRPEADDG